MATEKIAILCIYDEGHVVSDEKFEEFDHWTVE